MQERNAKERSSQKKSRLLKIVAVALMGLVSVSILGGLALLQSRANTGQYQHQSQLDPAVLAAQRQANIGRAKELRDVWQSWATAHQADLRAMLHAGASDRDKQMRVWELLPSGAESGVPAPLPVLGNALNVGSGAPWTWNPAVKHLSSVKLRDEENMKKASHYMSFYTLHKLPEDFLGKRDIEVSRALSIGPSSICLWASGRITDEKVVPNPQPGSGKRSFVQESEEIAPPYDFLQ